MKFVSPKRNGGAQDLRTGVRGARRRTKRTMITCCIFDLDGVVVDTAGYHYLAWAELARSLGFDFTPEQGEATRGITEEQKERMAAGKNDRYREYIARMTAGEVLPGVARFLAELRARGVKVVLGSASKNAGTILDRCGLRPLFDVVVDGTLVSKAKPDPEIFLRGAELAGESPDRCVVFEDAAAGIEAAARAGMRSVGVGGSPALASATLRLRSFEGFTFDRLVEAVDRNEQTNE